MEIICKNIFNIFLRIIFNFLMRMSEELFLEMRLQNSFIISLRLLTVGDPEHLVLGSIHLYL